MAIAVAQFTIRDENDITVGVTAPVNPIKDQMWLDTSLNPSVLKRYNGSSWDTVNETIVGGRNLLLKTGMKDGEYSLSGNVGTGVACAITVIDEITAPHNKAITLTRTDTTTSSGGRYWNAPTLISGNVYTWSIWLKGTGTWTVGQEQGGSKNITLTSTWTKYTYTFTENSSGYRHHQFIFYRVSSTTGGELSLHSLKLEEGNKASDWTPATEDIDQAITSVKTVTETNTTSINAIQGQISTLISNTTITIDGQTKQLKDAYNSTVATVSSILTTIGEHTTDIDANTTNITSVTAKAATLEANLNSISASLTSTQSTVSTHTTQITTVTNTANSAKSTLDTKSSTWDAKASTSYVDGKASEAETNAKNYAKTGNLYLRGTGLNRSASRILKINDSQIYNENSSRGLRLVTINRSTLAVVENIIYDVYGSDTAKTNLADKLNSLDDSVIVTLTSYDVIATNDSLDDAIQRVGGTGTRFGGSFHRVPFALVGIAGIGKGNGIEIFTGLDTTAPMAEIYTKIVDGVPQGINSASTVLANNASAAATTANTNASTALSTANTANSTATTASSNASTAVTTANSAVSTANTASTKASNAVSTANTASTNASSALTAANTATANVATLTTTVTSVTSRVTAVELTTSGLTTRVGATETAISTLEIGGRNLIRTSNIVYANSTISYAEDINTWTITIASGAGGGWGAGLSISSNHKVIIPNGRNYICSFEIYTPTALSWNVDVNNYAVSGTNWAGNDNDNVSLRKNSSKSILANTWTKCWFAYTASHASATGDIYDNSKFGLVNNTGSSLTYYIRNVKGELGNKPTDWTPSPEDIESSIADVKTYAATTINSNFTPTVPPDIFSYGTP